MISISSGLKLQRGAALVTTALMLVALISIAALGVEAFRMLSNRIQMQNVAEYIAEYDLGEAINAPAGAPDISIINQMLADNHFLGEGAGSLVACEGKSCGGPVQVARGCYSISSNFFYESSSCSPPDARAVYVRISTDGGRVFSKLLAQVFSVGAINISARAVAYQYDDPLEDYNVVGPYNGAS